MKILGVDQSYTSSGIVLIEDKELVLAQVFCSEKSKDIFWRAWDIALHISDLARLHKVDCVNIEGLAFGMRGDATRDLAGLQFLIVSQLKCKHHIPVVIVSPKSLKKFATTSGKAKKPEMFDALPEAMKTEFVVNYGFKKTKGLYDVVDAYWLALYKEEK